MKIGTSLIILTALISSCLQKKETEGQDGAKRFVGENPYLAGDSLHSKILRKIKEKIEEGKSATLSNTQQKVIETLIVPDSASINNEWDNHEIHCYLPLPDDFEPKTE
ncbi:MAG: hypothetical protein KKA07_18680 [Bacteroidetes bacterium]|nr:hypothetical protein [Bacteroidota bacterium]MBU1721098.1 hypothetical protein [Bacteroidota bacterium]